MTAGDLMKIASSVDSQSELLQVYPIYDEDTHELKDVWIAAKTDFKKVRRRKSNEI